MAVEVHPLDAARIWQLPARSLVRVRRPAEVMGIINRTPDSFSDGGDIAGPEDAVAIGGRMLAAGATWLDVGGESSRPGAEPVPEAIERARVVPVISALRAAYPDALISVDTCKATVAEAALAAGATMVNDITAGGDPAMFATVAAAGCPMVLMHMQGEPRTMQRAPQYRDLVGEIEGFFAARMRAAEAAGISSSLLVLDPGIGFGKTLAHNLTLLRSLPRLERSFDRPLMVGVSRKSFIARLVGLPPSAPPSDRDGASHVLHGLLARSCALLRVHDVAGAVAACRLAQAMSGEWLAHG